MHPDEAAIRTFFAKLGFDPEVAALYISLYVNGPQTISALSRSSGVERTRIYRLLDTLLDASLIEVDSPTRRAIMKTAPIINLRLLINKREQALKNLSDELDLLQQVLARNSLSNPAIRVQIYYGDEGLRRMLRNELSSKGEVISYGNRLLATKLDRAFLTTWTTARQKAGTIERQLVNDAAHAQQLSGYQIIERQLITKDIFSIANATCIYDNVTTHYQQKDGEVFGTEVYSQELADRERQFFNILWPQSTPITKQGGPTS